LDARKQLRLRGWLYVAVGIVQRNRYRLPVKNVEAQLKNRGLWVTFPPTYTFPMDESMTVDVSQFSFEEFIGFLFDRKVPAETESFAYLAERGETKKWNPWYWNTAVMFDPQRVCDYYIRLFRNPCFLLDRFSNPQLEQAFWGIQAANLDCSASNAIWNSDLPFALREECARSMFYLFRDLFATEPLESSVCMWWDSLCYDWHCGNKKRSRGGEDLAMQDVMFETLTEILALDSEVCQGAALHGLSHLHHPATEELIQNYLKMHPSLNEEWRDAALGAARFDLM